MEKYFKTLFILISIGFITNSCSKNSEPKITCIENYRAKWDYSKNKGPNNWFGLSDKYSLCKQGQHQSPINIIVNRTPIIKDLQLDYKSCIFDSIDNEHTVEFDYSPGSILELAEKRYELKQFHFHSPSEHTIDDQRYDMEIHFVHKSLTGKDLAVVALLVKSGEGNSLIQKLWAHLPAEKNKQYVFDKEYINAVELFPANLEAYFYHGSLTTPPCSETVS